MKRYIKIRIRRILKATASTRSKWLFHYLTKDAMLPSAGDVCSSEGPAEIGRVC